MSSPQVSRILAQRSSFERGKFNLNQWIGRYQLQPEQVSVEILLVQEAEDCIVEKSELVEMWVTSKASDFPRWLWHAIDRSTGQYSYIFGARKDEVFLQLSITRTVWHQTILYGGGAHQRYLKSESMKGKRKTQRIERKHLGLRTRIKRLTGRPFVFRSLELMHDLVIGLLLIDEFVYQFRHQQQI